MSDYRKTHTKEDIDAAIEAVNEEMSFIGHGFTDNQLKTILAALEQYKQPQASNTEALEALDRILMSYKLMLNNIELGTPKNEDGSKTLPPWLRDCRNDLKLSETIRTALEQSQQDREAVGELAEHLNSEPVAYWAKYKDGSGCIFQSEKTAKVYARNAFSECEVIPVYTRKNKMTNSPKQSSAGGE